MSEQANRTHRDLMNRVHGVNIYAGFVPTFAEDRQGWNSQHPAFEAIIGKLRPSVVIDVGVWKGNSTIHLAELMRRHGLAGAVIAVDTFLGSVEHWDRRSGFAGLMPFRHGLPLLYEQFLCNVVRSDTHHWIVPLAQTSANGAELLRRLGVAAGLIHIDASHEYEDVLRDARSYWEILLPGGYLIGDDYSKDWPGVIRAADQFAAEKKVPMMPALPKWIVRKPD